MHPSRIPLVQMVLIPVAALALLAVTTVSAFAQDAPPTPVPTFSAPGSSGAAAETEIAADTAVAAAGQAQQASAPGLEITPLAAAVVGAVAGALLAWAFARPMERAKLQEGFKVTLLQKRVETALQVQKELGMVIEQFLEDSAPCTDTPDLQRQFIQARRRVIALLGQTGFTNPLLYGYCSGLIHSNVLHEEEKKNAPLSCSTARLNYRQTFRLLTVAYSMALYRSTHTIWELETETAELDAVEAMAKTDVRKWYAAGRSMRNFKLELETLPTEALKAKICASLPADHPHPGGGLGADA